MDSQPRAARATPFATTTTLPYACQRCGQQHQLTRADPIKCQSCDHRILYKVRTTHSVVIEVD